MDFLETHQGVLLERDLDRDIVSPCLEGALEQNQEKRDAGIGQHQKEEGAERQSCLTVEIEVLRVPDGGQHTAQVGGDSLQDDNGDHQALSGLRPDETQDREGEGDKGDQRHVVCNGHAGEKAEQDQNPC